MLMFGSQAGAECGKLCDHCWWKTATDADVQAELDAGADVMAQDEKGGTIKMKNISTEKEKKGSQYANPFVSRAQLCAKLAS